VLLVSDLGFLLMSVTLHSIKRELRECNSRHFKFSIQFSVAVVWLLRHWVES